MTADSVYVVRNPAYCANLANSWPLVSAPLNQMNSAAPAPACEHDGMGLAECTCADALVQVLQ